MAFRWAVTSGNWSNTSTWDDGATLGVPTGSDIVSPNQNTVTIDTNITVTILTSARSGSLNVLGGGNFLVNDGVTITAYGSGSIYNGIWPYAPQASGSVLIVSQSNSIIISSSLRMAGIHPIGTGGIGNMLFMTGSSNVTVSGSVSGVAYAASNGWGVIHASTGTLRIFGTVEGAPGLGSVNGANGITTTSTGTTNITGDVYHHNFTANAANNPINMQTAAHTLIITGSVYQGDFATATISNASGNSNIYISGSLIGRTTGASAIIAKTTAGDIIIVGNITGQTAGGSSISHTSTGNIIVSGSIIKRGAGIPISTTGASTTIVTGSLSFTGSVSGPIISSTSGLVRIAGPAVGFNKFNPIFSPRIQFFSDTTPFYTLQSDTFGRNITFSDFSLTSSFLPAASNIRSGSIYGDTGQFIGSMVIPATSSVRYGVPVDNVTGSAVVTLTAGDIMSYAVQNLTSSNTIGARLKDIATTQTTAATIAAFKGR
jgi:hypothetical protein